MAYKTLLKNDIQVIVIIGFDQKYYIFFHYCIYTDFISFNREYLNLEKNNFFQYFKLFLSLLHGNVWKPHFV